MSTVYRPANLRGVITAIVFLFWLTRYGVAADEWPQFRGPDGQGHTEAVGLPITWSENENVTWKTALPGRGWSSPVVSGNEIWLTTAIDDERSLRAVAVEFSSGKLIRDIEVFRCDSLPPINGKNSYASPTPVVESGRLYAHFGAFGTACLDTATGRVLWTNRELTIDHKEGPGSSPVLYGDLLILNCDGIDYQYVAALNKGSGQLVWRRDRPGPHNPIPDFRKAYCTSLLVEVAGRPQMVSPGASRVVAYDPLTGDELWHVRYAGFSNVPRPVFFLVQSRHASAADDLCQRVGELFGRARENVHADFAAFRGGGLVQFRAGVVAKCAQADHADVRLGRLLHTG